MDLSQRYRQLITVPIWLAAVLTHAWLWFMWLGHRMDFAAFWRAEKIAVAVTVVMVIAEVAMHEETRN